MPGAKEIVESQGSASNIRDGKARAYHFLIEALTRQGRTEEVRAIYKKGIADLPDDPDGRATLVNYSLTAANALVDAKRWDEAIQLLNEAAAALPAKAAEELASLDFARQEAKAAEEFSQAIELTPDSWEAWNGRAWFYFNRQRWDKAVADYSEAIELAPQVHTNWLHRGHSYLSLAQSDKAAADFTKVIEGWPHDPGGWFFRGCAYAQLNQPEKAISDLRQSIAEGFKDIEHLKNETRLDPLRSNEEFNKLLATMEAEQK